jgi:hypothetical protein
VRVQVESEGVRRLKPDGRVVLLPTNHPLALWDLTATESDDDRVPTGRDIMAVLKSLGSGLQALASEVSTLKGEVAVMKDPAGRSTAASSPAIAAGRRSRGDRASVPNERGLDVLLQEYPEARQAATSQRTAAASEDEGGASEEDTTSDEYAEDNRCEEGFVVAALGGPAKPGKGAAGEGRKRKEKKEKRSEKKEGEGPLLLLMGSQAQMLKEV